MNATLKLLLSELYPGSLAPEHRADLEKSGLTAETIAQHKLRSIPPDLIDVLVGASRSQAAVTSTSIRSGGMERSLCWAIVSAVRPLFQRSARCCRGEAPRAVELRLARASASRSSREPLPPVPVNEAVVGILPRRAPSGPPDRFDLSLANPEAPGRGLRPRSVPPGSPGTTAGAERAPLGYLVEWASVSFLFLAMRPGHGVHHLMMSETA